MTTPFRLWPALLLAVTLAACSTSRPAMVDEEPPPPPPPVTEEVPEPREEPPPPPAPAEVPEDWFLRDAEAVGYPGIGVERAYATVLADRQPADTVVVAVIDSGIDIEHEDLRSVIWTNDDEVPGNGVDDDGNGYVDDMHGWNFIGGPDGSHVAYDTYEVTREYARLMPRFEGVDEADVAPEDAEDYAYYQELEAAYEAEVQQARQMAATINNIAEAVDQAVEMLKAHLGEDEVTIADAKALPADVPTEVGRARDMLLFLDANGVTLKDLANAKDQLAASTEYHLALDFDPRGIVGDDYDDVTERIYGNPDVAGPDPSHGTHVAGIIAADRTNDLGARGVAAPVEIMVLRAVPNGDERDKDVANAIRYAVDNGAQVINMSFGKAFSPQKQVVDAAVQYATERGVLLVHAAGNDGADVDVEANYPSRRYVDGGEAALWLGVGASTSDAGDGLAAPFSNFGPGTVDLFAPGDDIFSTLPGSTYGDQQGTSMAAPVVTGVAALLMAYYPDLTAAQVKDILLRSATRYADLVVTQPGPDGGEVAFGTLSATGGVVNAYEAVRLAETMTN